MKRKIISIIVALTALHSSVQAQTNSEIPDKRQNINAVPYQLFPTKNMWNFIKLDTRNGQMWQVQFVVNGDNRFETILNPTPLITKEKEANDRFTLYPTQNLYSFILLDQIDGRVWQVQWSLDYEKRLIIPIQ